MVLKGEIVKESIASVKKLGRASQESDLENILSEINSKEKIKQVLEISSCFIDILKSDNRELKKITLEIVYNTIWGVLEDDFSSLLFQKVEELKARLYDDLDVNTPKNNKAIIEMIYQYFEEEKKKKDFAWELSF